MKKFRFALDKVLNYKMQIQENLQGEHARCVQKTGEKALEIQALEQEHSQFSQEYETVKEQSVSVGKLHIFENYLESLSDRIRGEQIALIHLRKMEEAKRQEVIAARQEAASISMLKEKRIREYKYELQKEEERLVEEFVSNHMSGKIATQY